jgi:putative MATE family efflux protein
MKLSTLIQHFKSAVQGKELDYTQGSIRKSIFYLSIPMILEMVMESLFAVVDIFFVGKISVNAVATVGLTESVLTVIYSISIGLSMSATAIVARRIGEKKPKTAATAAFQAIFLGAFFAILIGFLGFRYSENLLRIMGGEDDLIRDGVGYTRIIFAGNVAIVLLFLINGVFRGAGNASIAMKALWLANGINIVLDPILIFGLGPIPALGLEGAAIATTTGRGIGVLFQLYILFFGGSIIRIRRENMMIKLKTIITIIKVSMGGMGQFLIESASWIFLTRIVAESGSAAMAGYTISIRLIIFTLLPALGFSNAAATLVGQNLGAGKPERAAKSAWISAHATALFLGIFGLVFFVGGDYFIQLFNQNPDVLAYGKKSLKIICLGYVFFGYGMVMSQSINGSGDTKTPTFINLFALWLVQIPLAYTLSFVFGLNATGVFISIAIAHSIHAIISMYVFNLGKWKLMKV